MGAESAVDNAWRPLDRRKAVVLSAAQYDRMLERVEDAEDLAAADDAMAAVLAEEPTIPWEDVNGGGSASVPTE